MSESTVKVVSAGDGDGNTGKKGEIKVMESEQGDGGGGNNDKIALIRSQLRAFDDFIPGVNFIDIMPIFKRPDAVRAVVDVLLYHIKTVTLSKLTDRIDVVVGLDARGFLIGPLVALACEASFVPVRKKGKLPGKTVTASYEKEYGKDIFDMQADAIKKDQSVIILDDLIATGGSAVAAGQLVKGLGGRLVEYLFIIELPFLKGVDKLDAPTYSILQYDD